MANGKNWTETEKQNLSQHFAHLGSEELAQAFPGRSARALNDMAQRLGVKKSRERLTEMGKLNSLVRWKKRQRAS